MQCRIGTIFKGSSKGQFSEAKNNIISAGLIVDREIVYENGNKLLKALAEGEIQIGIGALSEFPVFLEKDEIVIAAISGRESYGFGLLANKENVNEQKLSITSLQGNILVNNMLFYQQLVQFIEPEKVEFIEVEYEQLMFIMNENKDSSVLIPQRFDPAYDADTKRILIPMQPSEMTGVPGFGITAYIVHKEAFSFRKSLQKICSSQLIKISNVERTVEKKMGYGMRGNLGVYCQIDQKGNYRATAVVINPFKRINISQSTYIGLADKIVNELSS